ncbi:MAG: hypothetical protein ACHREM_00065 [Polyangiales bacterium]
MTTESTITAEDAVARIHGWDRVLTVETSLGPRRGRIFTAVAPATSALSLGGGGSTTSIGAGVNEDPIVQHDFHPDHYFDTEDLEREPWIRRTLERPHHVVNAAPVQDVDHVFGVSVQDEEGDKVWIFSLIGPLALLHLVETERVVHESFFAQMTQRAAIDEAAVREAFTLWVERNYGPLPILDVTVIMHKG